MNEETSDATVKGQDNNSATQLDPTLSRTEMGAEASLFNLDKQSMEVYFLSKKLTLNLRASKVFCLSVRFHYGKGFLYDFHAVCADRFLHDERAYPLVHLFLCGSDFLLHQE